MTKTIPVAEEATAYLRLPEDVLCVKAQNGIAVQAGAGGLLLEGDDARALVETLFPLLDGTRTEADILVTLAGASADDVRLLLEALKDHGLLHAESQPGRGRTAAGGRSALLAAAKVLLVGATDRTAAVAEGIRAAGVGTVRLEPQDFDDLDLAVGIFDGDTPQQPLDFAAEMHAAGIPSLTCIAGGAAPTIGPLATPGRSACWNCGRLRLRANARVATKQINGAGAADESLDRQLASAVCDALCLRDASPLVGQILRLDRQSMRTSLHRVLPVPGCGVCGGRIAGSRTPHRAESDSSNDEAAFALSLRMLSSFVDDRTGIVNRVVIESPDDAGAELPVIATAITAIAPDEAETPQQMPIGWGKGLNAAEAVVGAVGEAIERYAGSMPDAARIVCSRPDELTGSVLHPGEFALYADDQFGRAAFPYVRFDPDVAHPWIAGEWAGKRGAVWIPATLVFLSLEIRREHAFCQGSSNGLAAGTEASEAQLRAILELLERDAFMTSWLCKRPGRVLRIDGTLDASLRSILDGISARGAQIELVWLPSACGYPAVACLGFGDGITWPGVTFGLGTDPDPRRAVRQAILEFGQTGPFLQRMMTRDAHLTPEAPSDVSDMLDHARFYFRPERARAFDYLRDDADTCALADLPAGSERSLSACVDALAASNIRVALVDVTPADVAATGFVVMRAVSPDLQPISFGYGLDRLPIPRLRALGATVSGVSPIW